MAIADDNVLQLLVEAGLLSIVRTDAALRVTLSVGGAAVEVSVGDMLCEALPAMFGLDEELLALPDSDAGRFVLSNIAIVDRDGRAERLDYVVLPDPATGGFLLSITPSLANNELNIELEQNLREKLQLESRVAEQARTIAATNTALKRTNADLVNFTRIISHDLKAPMRAIRYSAEDIGEMLSETGDDAQLEALADLRQYSVRLSQMVTDLLTYSRLEDKSVAAAAVDTQALVQKIVKSLPRPDGLRLDVAGEWPEITTIGALLDVVLRNLIDNAIKHHDRGEGQISVIAERLDNMLVIVVNDDGPGIPKDYQQAVLRPFIKVKADHADSSGMGLSMVHKVITDVGGRIDVGDRLDGKRGTRIAVSWPLTILAT